MTKHLLTGLLIAGFSVTAKAEPTVYYCNTVSLAQVKEAGVSDIKSYPLKLFVDLEEAKIKISTDGLNAFEIDDGIPYRSVTRWFGEGKGEDAFFASDSDRLVDFRNGVLAVTEIGTIEENEEAQMIISSYLASCDKF